jgi:hypothetical protein
MIFRRSGKEVRACAVSLILWGSIISLGLFLLFPQQTVADASIPFAPGEQLRFRLRWAAIPAGEAVMEVLPMKTIDGNEVYHFRLTAESNRFVDLFYKVRDCIDAYANVEMTHAVRYRHKQHEGNTRRNVHVDFDWQEEMALYRDGKKDRQVDIVPGTFDPLSVIYFTRMKDYHQNKVIERPVSDGKKCVTGVARIIKKETITIPSGTYETYLIEPDLKHVGGVFEKDKDSKIKLWITADERRIPVKIASKVAIGNFVGELMTIKNGDS